MITKNRLKFLRRPVHKIPCHELNCKIILHTRACRKKYCHMHSSMGRMSKHHRKNVKKYQSTMQSPYGVYGETTQKICLKCGEPFGSMSKFNKVCDPCNEDNQTIRQHVGNISNSSLTLRNYGNLEGE